MRPPPPWLAEFQTRFSAMLRTPLDRKTGTLLAATSAYPPELVDETLPRKLPAEERLAVYNRQYWFRLFTALHGAFPLLARLLGHWTMNEHIARYVNEHPPRGRDLDELAPGFERFFAASLGSAPRSSLPPPFGEIASLALIEAATIDAAFHRVFRAPPVNPYAPDAGDAERLLQSRLIPSPAIAVVEQSFPLLELRRRLEGDPGETPVALPAALPQKQYSVIFRSATHMGHVPLQPLEARLLQLLFEHSVAEALGRLEAECSNDERARLPQQTRGWLAQSVKLGMWSGLDETTARTPNSGRATSG